MNAEEARKFIDSLEIENEDVCSMHGVPFDIPLHETPFAEPLSHAKQIEYFVERCRRAESSRIPDIKEKVKELVRCAMDAENRLHTDKWTDHKHEWKQYFDMCAPEVKP